MTNLEEKTVGEIVRENIHTADIFQKSGIDFCCGGNVNVQEACEKHGIDFKSLKKQLHSVLSTDLPSQNFDNWELDFLVDYILNTHHQYIVHHSDLVLAYTRKVAEVHGEKHPEVIEIHQLSEEMMEELRAHLVREERILFPYVKQLAVANRENEKVSIPGYGYIKSPIQIMESEHESVGEIVKKIAKLSNGYTTPSDACQTFKAMYAKLEEFQNDLFQHIHLENNILFPKAIELEKNLLL